MAGKDLGTYYVRVELTNGDGYLQKWETGARYTNGDVENSPLTAFRIRPLWEDEDQLAHIVEYSYRDGNGSCDCNKRLYLARAHQQPEPDEVPCGDELTIKALTLIRPDGSERTLRVGDGP